MVAAVGTAVMGDIEFTYGRAGYKCVFANPYIFFISCFASIGSVLLG